MFFGIFCHEESQNTRSTLGLVSDCSQMEKRKNDPRHLLHFRTSSFMTQVQRGDHSSLIKTPEHNVAFRLLIEELSWI